MLAKIAVSAAVYAIDKPYSYRVPEGMEVKVGVRVMVPFGKANRRCEGVILALTREDAPNLKVIDSLVDREPLLDDQAIHMAAFLRERYFCTFYDAIKAILPAGLWYQEKEAYAICREDWRGQIHRQSVALAVMETLNDLGGEADRSLLRKQFEEEPLQGALTYLLRKKLIRCTTDRKRRVQDKTEQIARLRASAEEALAYAATKAKSAPLQKAVLELVAGLGECAVKEICYFTGANRATLNRLEKLGFLEFYQEERLRIRQAVPKKLDGPLILNSEQQRVFEGLREQSRREKPGVALVYGVTGSGKTSVYIKLIDDCLRRGKSALLLVPEIALTPQLLSLFAAHFGGQVGVLHSSLPMTERYDTWKRIRGGGARVILGTRSAVFAPAQNLGLIIMDEEQEHTYKSENNPRYHAREVAIYRGNQTKALVVLGSATPSVETMYRAEQGVFTLYRMSSRYNQKELPPVELVDMKEELKQGNGTAISEPLLLALRENRENHRQSILFLNRRGTSRMVACVDCGDVPMCPGCTANLTYHQDNGRLMCHYCGYSQPLPGRCPKCGGHLKQVGFGTQKVEEQLKNLLPDSEVLRMDTDTVSAVNTHEKLLRRFQEEKIPILLGTQMVAKGLDFENVTLVGVLDADMSLYVGSYRAAETTFSMITQVVGRAGRGSASGRALIQTMTPKNQVLLLAARQDYDTFYNTEIPLRKLRGCPPFFDLLSVHFHGREEERVWQGALRFREALKTQLRSPFYGEEQVRVLGPAPEQMARINYNFRCSLTLSCKNTRTLRQLVSHLLREFVKDKQNKGIGVFADVNRNE